MKTNLIAPTYVAHQAHVLAMFQFQLIGVKPDVRMALYQRSDARYDWRLWVQYDLDENRLNLQLIRYEKFYLTGKMVPTEILKNAIAIDDSDTLLDTLLNQLYLP